MGPNRIKSQLPNIVDYALPIDLIEACCDLGQYEHRRDIVAAEERLRVEVNNKRPTS